MFNCPKSGYHFSISVDILKNYANGNLQPIHQVKRVFYLTSNCFLEGSIAQDKLALTYTPPNVFSYDPSLNDHFINNLGQTIVLTSPSTVLRSWPSFGYSGGAYELLLQCDKNSKINLKYLGILLNGGRLDPFRMDFVTLPIQNLNVLILSISQIFSEVYVGQNVEDDENNVMVKLQSGQFVFKFKLRQTDVSLSISYFLARNSEVVVRINGVAWSDDLFNSTREILVDVNHYFILTNIARVEDISRNVSKNTQGYTVLKKTIDFVMRDINSNLRSGKLGVIRQASLP